MQVTQTLEKYVSDLEDENKTMRNQVWQIHLSMKSSIEEQHLSIEKLERRSRI